MFRKVFANSYFLILEQRVKIAHHLHYPHLSREQSSAAIPPRVVRCTVNIYRYKTIEANGNTSVIPTTSKSFSLYQELLQHLQVNYHFMVNYPWRLKQYRLKDLLIASIVLYRQVFTVWSPALCTIGPFICTMFGEFTKSNCQTPAKRSLKKSSQ